MMDFKNAAQEILHTGKTDKECFYELQQQGFKQSFRTFNTYIAIWREDPDFPEAKKGNSCKAKAAAILSLCQQPEMSDNKIVQCLKEQGIKTTARAVQDQRLKLGIKYRNRLPEEQEVMYNHTLDAVRSEIQDGPARNYGRGLISTQLQRTGIKARQRHIRASLSQTLQEQGRQRSFAPRNAKNRKAFASYPGPDYIWSLDGHDKLVAFGVEIYAAIDAYSRYVVYCYVGISNKTQISVCKQYLEAVSTMNWCPRFLRTDRGTEVPMMADLHHSLYKAFQQDHFPTDFDATNCRLEDCHIFGKSVHNHRIESWWNGLEERQLQPWRVHLYLGWNANAC